MKLRTCKLVRFSSYRCGNKETSSPTTLNVLQMPSKVPDILKKWANNSTNFQHRISAPVKNAHVLLASEFPRICFQYFVVICQQVQLIKLASCSVLRFHQVWTCIFNMLFSWIPYFSIHPTSSLIGLKVLFTLFCILNKSNYFLSPLIFVISEFFYHFTQNVLKNRKS